MASISAPRPTAPASLPFKRRLHWQILLVMLLLAVVPLLFASATSLVRMRMQANEQVVRQLSSVVELKHDQIGRWIGDALLGLDLFLSAPVRAELVAFLEGGGGDTAGRERIAALFSGSVDLDHEHKTTPIFRDWIVYDREGRILASSDPAQLAKVVRREPYFAPSLLAEHVQAPYYSLGSTELTMYATHPLIDGRGQVLGAIAGQLNLDALGSVMLERTGLPASGETYLVSLENNFLLTPSRFEGVSLFTPYTSDGITRALHGEQGSAVYGNYLEPPVQVIGVYKWLPELNAALIGEVELSEAEGIFVQTATISLLLILLTLAVTVIAALFFARWLGQPISNLTSAALKLSAGDLSERVQVKRRNELGALGAAFNTMADRLAATMGSLETRVAERTAALETANSEAQRALVELRAALEARDQLSETVRQLASPVLPLSDGVLVVPLIGAIDSERAQLLTRELLGAVERHKASHVLIDVTGVPVVDTQVARVLLDAASAVRLLGGTTALVGLRPELAQTIVGLGVDLSAVATYADLQAGLRRIERQRKA